MIRKFKSLFAGLAIAALSLTSLSSCDLDDLTNTSSDRCTLGTSMTDIFDAVMGSECTGIQKEYNNVIQSQGTLLDIETVKARMETNPKDYAMAMVLNASALNKLFKKASTWNSTELPSISIGGCHVNSEIDAIANLIGLNTYPLSADNCLTFNFGIKASSYNFNVSIGVPITPVVKGDDPSKPDDYAKGLRTSIFADLPKAQLLNLTLNNSSVPSAVLALTSTLLKTALDGYLKRVSLFDISAWEMGDNNIKMIAGGPVTNEAEGTLTLGMYSNINMGLVDSTLGEDARVTWEEAFPKDAEIGLHIHPDLIRGILNLMFAENYIESDLTVDAAASGVSAFKVTMADMASYPMQTLLTCGDNWADYFTIGMRMWSTSNPCGYFDLLAGLHLEISNNKLVLGLGNVQAGQAKGIGSLAKLAVNSLTGSKTFQDLLSQATLAINYDQFKVPTEKDNVDAETAKVKTDAVDFLVDGNGISLYLNFLDL